MVFFFSLYYCAEIKQNHYSIRTKRQLSKILDNCLFVKSD